MQAFKCKKTKKNKKKLRKGMKDAKIKDNIHIYALLRKLNGEDSIFIIKCRMRRLLQDNIINNKSIMVFDGREIDWFSHFSVMMLTKGLFRKDI